MKRYIKSETITSMIPSQCSKYYQVDNTLDEWEVADLAGVYHHAGLEWIAALRPKSRYQRVLELAEIDSVSLCKDSDGDYGVYALTGDRVHNITDNIPYIVDRARRDMR